MAIPSQFDGQFNPGLPVQMTKEASNENMFLNYICTDDDGDAWVIYTTTYHPADATYTVRVRKFDIGTETWGSSIEIAGSGGSDQNFITNYGSISCDITSNINGDMLCVWTSGNNAGNGRHWVRVLHKDGTLEAVSEIPNAGGNITRASAVASNNCFDWTIVDEGGSLVGPNRIRAIDYNSTTLTWGNERYLYRSDTYGVDYDVTITREGASFSPPENSVHVVAGVQEIPVGASDPFHIIHAGDGFTPHVFEIPENLVTSTSYLFPYPRITCDNSVEGKSYVMYVINANDVGGELNNADSVMHREITDLSTVSGATTFYTHTGPPYGAEAVGYAMDGMGGLVAYHRREAVEIEPGLIWKYATPVNATAPYGYAALKKMHEGAWMVAEDDVQEVFFSQSGATYSNMQFAKPFPHHSVAFVAANRQDADGGAVGATDGIWINYAEVLEAAVDEDGERITEGCMGTTFMESPINHQVLVFDERVYQHDVEPLA